MESELRIGVLHSNSYSFANSLSYINQVLYSVGSQYIAEVGLRCVFHICALKVTKLGTLQKRKPRNTAHTRKDAYFNPSPSPFTSVFYIKFTFRNRLRLPQN